MRELEINVGNTNKNKKKSGKKHEKFSNEVRKRKIRAIARRPIFFVLFRVPIPI